MSTDSKLATWEMGLEKFDICQMSGNVCTVYFVTFDMEAESWNVLVCECPLNREQE